MEEKNALTVAGEKESSAILSEFSPNLSIKNGHKAGCACMVCARVRKSREQGKPSKKQLLEARKARRIAREARKNTSENIFARTIASQVLSGTRVNPTSAAFVAGYRQDTSANVGTDLLRSPKVQTLVLAALEQAGITQETLAQTASEGLQATETKHASYEGKFTDERKVPDFHVRHKFFETLNRIFGNFPKEETTQQSALILKLPSESSPEEAELALANYFRSRQVVPEVVHTSE